MRKRVLTFLGWGLSSLLFVTATFAFMQDEPPIALGIVFILWGILCLPPLYTLTQRLETYGSAWNVLSRLGLALLIPAFLAPWIAPKDLSFYQRVRNPFEMGQDVPVPRATPQPTATKDAKATPSPTPAVIVSGTPLPVLKAQDLKKGQTYIVADQTYLMATNTSTDVVADIQQMKLIPKGGLFKVLETVDKENKRWYQVAAFDKEKKQIGSGWINSLTLAEEVAASSPLMIPSAIQSGMPTPSPSSSIAAIIANAQGAASASPTATSLDAPAATTSPKPSPSSKTTPQPSASVVKPLKSPSEILGAVKSKSVSPGHRVSTEPMTNGSRIIIETEDPNISRDQCMALVKTYMAKAGGKGQIVVYKPNPKPPWNGRVLAFCFNDLDDKGTVMNDFYGW
jgi:hypothetical protein